MERMESAVVGIAATFDVAAVLQLIDVGDDPAGNNPNWPLSACWLRPGSAAIARRIPACGGVRSIDAIRSANTEAERWPSWDSKNATLSPSLDAADTHKSYQL